MKYKGIQIENTFAEAFNMKASRIIVTADNLKWAKNACDSFTGFATSVIACGIEAGIEKQLNKTETPDGRHGYSILLFSMSRSIPAIMPDMPVARKKCLLIMNHTL